MQPAFVFSVHDLREEPRDIDAPLSPAWLAHALLDTETVSHDNAHGQVQVRLSMTGREVVVHGKVTAELFMKCGRCLQDAPVHVEAELALLLSPAPVPASPHGKNELTPRKAGAASKKPRRSSGKSRDDADDDPGYVFASEEADLDTYAGDEVVLDGFIREAILLELPIFPLCSEACPGIGAVLPESDEPPPEATPVDPRLAPLMRFRKK